MLPARIGECEVFLLLVTETSVRSQWAMREFDWAAASVPTVLPPDPRAPYQFSEPELLEFCAAGRIGERRVVLDSTGVLARRIFELTVGEAVLDLVTRWHPATREELADVAVEACRTAVSRAGTLQGIRRSRQGAGHLFRALDATAGREWLHVGLAGDKYNAIAFLPAQHLDEELLRNGLSHPRMEVNAEDRITLGNLQVAAHHACGGRRRAVRTGQVRHLAAGSPPRRSSVTGLLGGQRSAPTPARVGAERSSGHWKMTSLQK
ncbi:hypothetical protein ACIQMJ_20105 [Actinosynnema sp. NPDC091369]